SACSSGTNMTGGGKDDEAQKRKSAREAVAETPAGTTEEPEGEGELDEDLRVIPPEVVSGAYLTCASEERQSEESGGSVLYGCNVFDSNDRRVDVEDVRPQWRLFAGGEIISAPEIRDERYHKAWKVAAEIAAKGLN